MRITSLRQISAWDRHRYSNSTARKFRFVFGTEVLGPRIAPSCPRQSPKMNWGWSRPWDRLLFRGEGPIPLKFSPNKGYLS